MHERKSLLLLCALAQEHQRQSGGQARRLQGSNLRELAALACKVPLPDLMRSLQLPVSSALSLLHRMPTGPQYSEAHQNGLHTLPDALQDGHEASQERLRVGADHYLIVEGEVALLGMLQAYESLQQLAPDLAPEIAHRAVEILKVVALSWTVFNHLQVPSQPAE